VVVSKPRGSCWGPPQALWRACVGRGGGVEAAGGKMPEPVLVSEPKSLAGAAPCALLVMAGVYKVSMEG
jgi:hypothetical protein